MELKEKWHKFEAWQKEPYGVAPMSDEEHLCSTCATEYVGNYCPRCGQSAQIGPHMSLWKTFLLFLDVWGLGNRGMFRTLRDLILRPGYLISDYIKGKHFAYFPPFKLLFLLTALSLLIGSGWNLRSENYINDFRVEDEQLIEEDDDIPKKEMMQQFVKYFNIFADFQKDYPPLNRLLFLSLSCIFFYRMFRKSKRLGLLSFHEMFIAMVYMACMGNIYSIVFEFFGAGYVLTNIFASTMYIIPLRQMSGYSWFKTAWRFLVSYILYFLLLGILLVLFIFLIGVKYFLFT